MNETPKPNNDALPPSAMRTDYKLGRLSDQEAGDNPFSLFDRWFKQAVDASTGPIFEPNVMTLATSTPDGIPDARIVLLKGYSEAGFTFFTNYDSAKGRQLEANPNAALVLHWIALERQIRINGTVTKTSATESDAYFATRPRESQLGAWVSNQSQPTTAHALESEMARLTAEHEGRVVPRPPHWGGFIVAPKRIEFWQGRPGRLHDRILFDRKTEKNNWSRSRLAP